MDPPETSVNRFGRTIWTVWGYLSGAVARYLRPEVTTGGNQSVLDRTEEIDLKSEVKKNDREVKTNNGDSEDDRAEVKGSSSKVRVAASVQWENTSVVNNDNNDKLHLHTTEKQTYPPAAWSTGTEAHREGQRDSSDDVQTEEEHANREREITQELEITGETEQKDGDNKEEREENHGGEKCAEKREDTDIIMQSEQDEGHDKQTIMMDHRETEDTGGLKPADEHPTETQKTEDTVQKNQEKTESDEDQEPESQVQALLEDLTNEANKMSKPERPIKAMDKCSDEIDEFFKNQIEEMMLETEQDEERKTTQELETTGESEQKDDDNKEEGEENHEKCAEKRADTGVMIHSEQDEEHDKQTIMMDHRETEDTGGLKPADEHPTETQKTEDTVQKNQEKTESDEDQEPESQVQAILEDLTNEANKMSKPERPIKAMDKYSDEIDEFFKNQIEEMMLETEQDEERKTTQELETTGESEQKDDDNKEEGEENHEKCAEKRANTGVMIHSEQDEEHDKQTIMMDHRETEDTGGLKPADEHPTETQKTEDTVQKNQEKAERNEDQEPESQVQEDLTNKENNINEFSKSGVEEMMLGSEQDKENTERKQDMTKYELMESAETLQKDSESEEHASTDETELRMTTVVVETIEALEDTLRMDSEQDTSENTPESETVLATKTEAMFSNLTVCEFFGEPRTGQETDWGCFEEIQTKLHDSQTPKEERSQRDSDESQHNTETVIQTDRTHLSLREHDEFRTELIVETIESKISSKDEEADALETESKAPVISNVTSQPHQSLEFTERLYKSSQETMDAFSETHGNASASETEDRAEPVSTELLGEPQDVEKTALQFVEELTNQVLNEMIGTETEHSEEDPAPADSSVLEEAQKILTVDSSEGHISSGPEADGHHEQMQKSITGETVSRSQEDLMEVSRCGMKKAFDQVSTGLPETKTGGRFDLILQAFEDSSLDFSVQKCRIAVKNPLVRPPKDPRKLLFRTSVEPQTLGGSAPNKPMIGFKLPGLGAGLPRLRKTEFGQKAEAERTVQQKSVTEESVKQEQVPAKPKWTPPRHPGMGSPFMMAELKSKLKKPVQE